MGRIQRICRLGGLLFFLFALAVSIQLNLIYWCVPFWTRFEVPVEFVFEPKRPQNGEASVVIAQANTLVPSVLVRRLWSRRRGPDSESTSRWTDCFSLDAASFRRGCERSGTIDLELHWTLPDSIRNEQAGTITVELALWQIPHPRSRLQPAPAPLPLCQRRRSVRVLAYRSPTERALRSLLSLPQHFIGALDVWRWSKRPARLSPRNAQRRCIQLLRCAPLQMSQVRMNQTVTLARTPQPGRYISLISALAGTIARLLARVWDLLGRQVLRDWVLGSMFALIPLGIGEWLNDRYVLSEPPYLLQVRLRLYQFVVAEAKRSHDLAIPSLIEVDDCSASMHFEWVLVGWRRFLRHHYLLGTVFGSWIIFILLVFLYALYRIWHGRVVRIEPRVPKPASIPKSSHNLFTSRDSTID
ncbi:hypothetical protein CCYA_CCYA12G3278 [Cyanidiococcus yangmingshanensis]|nr:hypothetical protein CCYA_CCYA12G3278 [Cyanidiococcus yangmingshanensis]